MDVPRPDTPEPARLAAALSAACSAADDLAYELVALHLVLVADLRHLVESSLPRVVTARDALERIDARPFTDHPAPAGSLPPTTIGVVADRAPAPWGPLLRRHGGQLRLLLDEIERTSAWNARTCVAILRELDALLAPVDARAARRTPRLVTAGAGPEAPPEVPGVLGERRLLGDLALPRLEGALRRQRSAIAETARVMARPVAPTLRAFLSC